MPVYVDGELAFGREPGGDAPDETAPAPPTPLSVTGIGPTAIGLSWSAVTDDGSGIEHYAISGDGIQRTTVPAGTTSTTLEMLSPATDYEVAVRAVDGAGNGSELATGSATTATVEDGPDPLDGTEPTDPDEDGVYEDLNGNGETDYSDVVRYFDEIDGEYFAENAEYFDFNGNGEADYSDLVALFQAV
ncbi:fibronectin type III domain-containing protein [Halomicrobium urmianum]|uniref:fibronectin type III domain-containing protein n=1 Tax=Halomicrobium urmianum TaxID=1586233 RepID=UPI001CD9FACE|nr:fibronectin type III domain-containing protein [Halomicrobium urmianum]